jgi:nucleotide-binding universal stress UspA family protein
MFLDILVGIDGSASSWRALDYGIELARAGNAKLTLITVAPPVSGYVTLAGVSNEKMHAELDRWAQEMLAKAEERVPADVIAHTIQKSGDAGPEIVKAVNRGSYDLIVLGSRGRGRAQEGLLGSVNAYVHHHARVPLLTVPDGGTDDQSDQGA